jgi:hypothetical protein
MHDLLYENQFALSDRSLASYAQRLGLEQDLIESAREDRSAARVQRDFSSGARSVFTLCECPVQIWLSNPREHASARPR